VKQPEILGKIGFLKAWADQPYEEMGAVSFPEVSATKIYFVNKEKAPQSEIRIGYLAMPFDADGEYFRSNVMNYALGGNFNSRINLTLRGVPQQDGSRGEAEA
jgi:zinc protease